MESNPGLVSDDSETRFLEAISALDHRIMEELRGMKSEIMTIKAEFHIQNKKLVVLVE